MLSDVIGMFLTVALIAVQFYFGQKQKLRLGLILPILFVVIFAIMCLVDGSPPLSDSGRHVRSGPAGGLLYGHRPGRRHGRKPSWIR